MQEAQKTTESNNVLAEYKIEYVIGQIVYLKTDNEQYARIVTGINLRPSLSVTYCLSFGSNESCHYAFEISDERDIIMATSN